MPGQLAPQGRLSDSETNALAAAHAALEKQAEQVVVVDLRSLSSVTDFFVICTAGSGRQLDALKDHIDAVLSARGCPVWHVEGSPAAPARGVIQGPLWVLMDYGDLVVHLMDQQARSFYQLEQLWADAPRVALAQAPLR
jgi:ribosome-associated protein